MNGTENIVDVNRCKNLFLSHVFLSCTFHFVSSVITARNECVKIRLLGSWHGYRDPEELACLRFLRLGDFLSFGDLCRV